MQNIVAIVFDLATVLNVNGQSPSFNTYMNPVIPGDHSDYTVTKVSLTAPKLPSSGIPWMVPKSDNFSTKLFPNWMLLSYNKPVEVSSELPSRPRSYVANEDIRTNWSAKTGDKGELISMDLQNECTINAIQINYTENETKIKGRQPGIYYPYLLEYSSDSKTWKTLADKTLNKSDVPHDYIELVKPIKARYIKLTNYKVPSDTFALAGLQVFGNGGGKVPSEVKNLNLKRSETDRCVVNLSWAKMPGAVGYNFRYGTSKDKLHQNYQALGTESVTIRSLNALQKYYFTVDAFNENGNRKGKSIVEQN